MKVDDAVTRAMALNYAAYNESSVRALGVAAFQSRSLWWREPGGSPVYLAALILDSRAPDEQILGELDRVHRSWGTTRIVLYDCWARRDLRPAGYVRVFQTPWYLRRASALEPVASAPGLSVEIVKTPAGLADFEQATCIGFEMPAAELPTRFGQHAEATLHDPGMFYLNARLGGDVVASTAAYATDEMLGIYAISTLPAFRRRGYGSALVGAAVALRPNLQVSVYPDPPTVAMYAPFEFERAGEIACWVRG